MNANQDITLWVGALRYYLGRQTYAVTDFCNLLIQEWGNISYASKTIIERDVEAEFKRYDEWLKYDTDWQSPLGGTCDVKAWESVRKLWAQN